VPHTTTILTSRVNEASTSPPSPSACSSEYPGAPNSPHLGIARSHAQYSCKQDLRFRLLPVSHFVRTGGTLISFNFRIMVNTLLNPREYHLSKLFPPITRSPQNIVVRRPVLLFYRARRLWFSIHPLTHRARAMATLRALTLAASSGTSMAQFSLHQPPIRCLTTPNTQTQLGRLWAEPITPKEIELRSRIPTHLARHAWRARE